jgi:DNA-binding transcriptional ArsR family regulator
MAYGTVMMALADPTRRALFERLRSRPHTVGELARIARIRDRREGTRRYYSASQEGLAELRRYVERMWDDVLTAYAAGDPHPPTKDAATPRKKRGAR